MIRFSKSAKNFCDFYAYKLIIFYNLKYLKQLPYGFKTTILCVYARKIAWRLRRRWQKGLANRVKTLVVVTHSKWLYSITWKFLSNFLMGWKTAFCLFMNENFFWQKSSSNRLKMLVVVTYNEWLFSITYKILSNFHMGLKNTIFQYLWKRNSFEIILS